MHSSFSRNCSCRFSRFHLGDFSAHSAPQTARTTTTKNVLKSFSSLSPTFSSSASSSFPSSSSAPLSTSPSTNSGSSSNVATCLRVARKKSSESLLNLRDACNRLTPAEIVGLFHQLRPARAFDLEGRQLVYSVLVDRTTEISTSFSSEQLLNIMSYLPNDVNSVGNGEFGLASLLTEFVQEKMHEFSPSDVTKALQGVNATSQGPIASSGMVVKKLCARARIVKGQYDAFDIVKTIDCVVGLHFQEYDIILDLCARAREILPTFSGGDLADLVYNLSAFRSYHVVVPLMINQALTFMASAANTKAELHAMRANKNSLIPPVSLLPKHMVKILYAMGSFDQFDTRATKKLCAALLELIDEIDQVDSVKLLAALAQLQAHEAKRIQARGPRAEGEEGEDYEKTLVLKTWNKVLEINPGRLSPAQLDRIGRMRLALELEHPDWPLPLTDRLEAGLRKKPTRFNELKSRGAKFSPLHKEVCEALSAMKFEYGNEHQIGPMKVDIALTGDKVCIEVNGPSHHDRLSRLMTGSCRLKRRMLSHLGWKVVDISWYEWNLHSTQSARELYLRNLLKPVLPLFSAHSYASAHSSLELSS